MVALVYVVTSGLICLCLYIKCYFVVFVVVLMLHCASHRYLGLSMMCNKKRVFLSLVSSCNVVSAVLSS